MKFILATTLFTLANAALPDDVTSCNPPDPNRPDQNWMSISERIDATDGYVFYAKAIAKEDIETSMWGQSYTVEWSLECLPIKQPARYAVPQTFKMENLGTFPPSYIPCGPRNVITGFNYIIFAERDQERENFDYYVLEEFNDQDGIIRVTNENKLELAPYLYECLSGDECHDDADDIQDNWEPMLLADRIKASEYAFEVIMNDDTTGCIQCVLNEPSDPSIIEPLFSEDGTFQLTEHHKNCHDPYDVKGDGETKYIMMLEREEASGTIDKNNELSPDEVNGQMAIYELTSEIQAELDDYLAQCPAQLFTCNAEPEPETTQAPAPEPETTQEPVPDSGFRMLMSMSAILALLALY